MKPVEIIKDIEAVGPALYLKQEDILIFSDMHIGYEEALVKQGMFVPKFHFKDLVKQVEKVLEDLGSKPRTIVINGDLKHEFGTISEEEWRNTLKMLDFLKRNCEKLVLVKGNHDTVLGPIAEKRDVLLVDSLLDGDKMIIHGDKLVEVPAPIKTIIIGHEHAAVSIHEDLRKETYKCYLIGNYNRKKLIVMPSMNPLVEGSDILADKPLSPFLKKDIGNFEVHIVEGDVYNFGKINQLRK